MKRCQPGKLVRHAASRARDQGLFLGTASVSMDSPPDSSLPGGKARVKRKPLDVQNLRHSQPPRSVRGMAETRTKSKAPDASQRGALHTGLPMLPFCHTLSLRLYVEQHVPLAVAAHSRRQPAQGHLPHRQKLCVRHPHFAAHLAST